MHHGECPPAFRRCSLARVVQSSTGDCLLAAGRNDECLSPMSDWLRECYRDVSTFGLEPVHELHSVAVSGRVAGNLLALSEIENAAIVLHGPHGCGYQFRHAPRRRHLPIELSCSNLNWTNIVFGGKARLTDAIERLLKRPNLQLIGIVPTCVTEVIGDDLSMIVRELKRRTSIPLVTVSPTAFSHANKCDTSRAPRGCGFADAMKSIVDQVMEPQARCKHLVCLEGFAWGHGGAAALRGLARELESFGVGVHAILPSCSVERLRTAPRAVLNIVRRPSWADHMQRRLGTEYLDAGLPQAHASVERLGRFYADILSRLGLRAALNLLARKQATTLDRLAPLRKRLTRYAATLVCGRLDQGLRLLAWLSDDCGLSVRHLVCDDEVVQLTGAPQSMSRLGTHTHVAIRPSADELRQIERDTTHALYVGLPKHRLRLPGVSALGHPIPLDFEGLVTRSLDFARALEQSRDDGRQLLTRQLRSQEPPAPQWPGAPTWRYAPTSREPA